MTGALIEITVAEGRIGEALQRLADRAIALTDPLAEIGELLVTSTQARFRQAVAPDGTPWAPLAPRTLASKKGPGILRENLHLMGSIRYQVGSDQLELGTNLPYGAIHQLGGKIKRDQRRATLHFRQNTRSGLVGNRFVKRSQANFVQDVTIKAHETDTPARPYLGLSVEDEAQILEVLTNYLMDG